MTKEYREYAKSRIEYLLKISSLDERDKEALEAAIQALSQEPTDTWSIKDVADTFKKHGLIREQEPCDDAISRNMALEKMADYVASGYADSVEDFEEYSRIICQLPPVTQKPDNKYRKEAKRWKNKWLKSQKSGKWIEKEGWDGDVYYECSVCEEPFCLIDGTPTDNMYNYCPNCGAKMESEDKE